MGSLASSNHRSPHSHKPRLIGGLAFMVVSVACAWGALVDLRNQSLFLLFSSFAIIAALSLVYSAALAALIAWRCRRAPRQEKFEADCDEVRTLDFALLPPFLARWSTPTIYWSLLKGGRVISSPGVSLTASGQEAAAFLRRCHLESSKSPDTKLIRQVYVSDPMGLFVFTVSSVVNVAELLIRPNPFLGDSPSKLRSVADVAGAKASASGSPQGDMVEMREFREGDSARLMIWKILAKTGGQRKMVRVEERVEAQRTALYLFASPGDDRAAAFARNYLLCGNVAGDWFFGVSGSCEIFSKGKGQPIERTIRAISHSGLHDFSSESIIEFKAFMTNLRRARIQNPIALIGGAESDDTTKSLCEQIRRMAPGCGILLVPESGELKFLN